MASYREIRALAFRDYTSGYTRGFRNGRTDAFLGLTLRAALVSNVPGYTEGYRAAQREYARTHPNAAQTYMFNSQS